LVVCAVICEPVSTSQIHCKQGKYREFFLFLPLDGLSLTRKAALPRQFFSKFPAQVITEKISAITDQNFENRSLLDFSDAIQNRAVRYWWAGAGRKIHQPSSYEFLNLFNSIALTETKPDSMRASFSNPRRRGAIGRQKLNTA
jgi:hypothetical protein